ncbi:MAG: acyl carrier protein [Gammaproteobacteria bacterium]|nr:acyl carrier protein [Gammaproteobacteria bacterium]
MSERQEIVTKACQYLQQIAGSGVSITPQTNIAEELSLDSVKVLDLVMELEDEFDISVPLNLMADVQTVNDLVDLIEKVISENDDTTG